MTLILWTLLALGPAAPSSSASTALAVERSPRATSNPLLSSRGLSMVEVFDREQGVLFEYERTLKFESIYCGYKSEVTYRFERDSLVSVTHWFPLTGDTRWVQYQEYDLVVDCTTHLAGQPALKTAKMTGRLTFEDALDIHGVEYALSNAYHEALWPLKEGFLTVVVAKVGIGPWYLEVTWVPV